MFKSKAKKKKDRFKSSLKITHDFNSINILFNKSERMNDFFFFLLRKYISPQKLFDAHRLCLYLLLYTEK